MFDMNFYIFITLEWYLYYCKNLRLWVKT